MVQFISEIWGPPFIIGVGVGGMLAGFAMVAAGLILGTR